MTETIIEAAIAVHSDGPRLEVPHDATPGAVALAIAAFDAFTDGLELDQIPYRAEDARHAVVRHRFLVEDDGTAFVGGRIS